MQMRVLAPPNEASHGVTHLLHYTLMRGGMHLAFSSTAGALGARLSFYSFCMIGMGNCHPGAVRRNRAR
eukprot:8763406-Karenia_brevis.AAC.1